MTHRTLPLNESLAAYLLNMGITEHPVLQALREFTAKHRLAKMQIAPEQGQLLAWLAQLIQARHYIELGTFTGYSALAVALAMPQESEVVTCDVSDAFTAIAQNYWEAAGVSAKIKLFLQPAALTLETLLKEGRSDSFDLAFIDADKPNTLAYYEACLKLVRPGGIIGIDNVFLGGRVANASEADPPAVHNMQAFNLKVKSDSRVSICVLPIGDGMTLATRLV